MKKPIAIAVLLLCSLLIGARCVSGNSEARPAQASPEQEKPAQTKPGQANPESVADLCKDPSRYADQTVRLKGVFQGFRVAECRFPEAAGRTGLTRSDWLIRTGDDCLYVTGGAPADVDVIDPAYVGRRVEISARVSRNEAGKISLKYVEGRLIAE